MDKPLLTSKTVWAGILAAIAQALQCVISFFNGQSDVQALLVCLATALATAFGVAGIRDLIGKIASGKVKE